MKFLVFIAVLLAALATGLMPLNAASGMRLQVVAFGDSLLDAGTYSPFAKATFNGGRFTTNPGLNFTQDIALHYGDRLTPAFVGGFGQPLIPAGGLDYAQGGSRVTLQPGIGHAPPGTKDADFAQATTVPVRDQVGTYLSTYKRFTSNQLVLINGGANDIFFQLAAAQAAGTPAALLSAVEAITRSAVDLAKIVRTVIENGATHVVVMNVPDIGRAPEGLLSPDHGQLLTAVSRLFNISLAAALDFQRKIFGDNVTLIDAFGFIDQVIANFRVYGFSVSNTGIACNLSAQIARAVQLHLSNPSSFGSSLFCSPGTYTVTGADRSFMFADTVHPTTHLNELFALFVEQQIAARIWQVHAREGSF